MGDNQIVNTSDTYMQKLTAIASAIRRNSKTNRHSRHGRKPDTMRGLPDVTWLKAKNGRIAWGRAGPVMARNHLACRHSLPRRRSPRPADSLL